MKQSPTQEEVRSEEVQDIISYIPSWITRWGNALLLLLIGLFVVGLYCIRYPEVITSEITITTPIPPAKILSRSSGKLMALLVRNNQPVGTDQALAILESTADYKDVSELKEFLNFYRPDSSYRFQDTQHHWKLGELEAAYSAWKSGIEAYEIQLLLDPEKREATAIQVQVAAYDSLLKKQRSQLKLFGEELGLIGKDYLRNEALHVEKAISVKEFEEKKREFLQAKRNLETLKIAISNTAIARNELTKSLTLLQINNNKNIFNLKRELSEAERNLRVAILGWEQKHVIFSPIKGRLSYLNYWTPYQFIRENEEIFSVVPGSNGLLGKVLIPMYNSGKVKPGQVVNICLESYPCDQWGMLKGRVTSIAQIPQQGTYSIEVEIVSGLTTTYNKQLAFKQEMKGTARIITEKLRLIDQIFYPLRHLFDQS